MQHLQNLSLWCLVVSAPNMCALFVDVFCHREILLLPYLFLIEVSSPSLYWNQNHKRNRSTLEELTCNAMQYCKKSYLSFDLSLYVNWISALNDCPLVNLGVFSCLSAVAVGLPSHSDR